MDKPQFFPILEVRKLGGNCSANCPGCSSAINDDYSQGLELSHEQEEFIRKITDIFNFKIDRKENTTLGFSIPFPFDKITFDEFKKTILKLNIDTAGSFGFMLSDNIDDLNLNLDDILRKIKYVFELNIEKTGNKKNSTLELCSNKGGLKKLNEKKDDLINPIKKITKLCSLYVKDEIALQLGRLVVSEKNYTSNQIEAKKIIEYIRNKLNDYNTELEIIEDDNYSEYNIEINTNNKKKIIIHFALVKNNPNYIENIDEHKKLIQSMGTPLLLSTLDNGIQINHSLGKANDRENLIEYNEIFQILEDINILKEKLLKIDFLKDINFSFFLLQKINIIKEISIKRNIENLLKGEDIIDIEIDSIFTTFRLIENSDFKLVEHTKKGLFPVYVLGTYLRIKILSLLEKRKNNN